MGTCVTVSGLKGVVFELNGLINKIVSCLETSASWSGAKSWCSSYGEGKWYLPNRDELKAIYYNKSTLNNTLSACGGTTLGTSYYWSSAEFSRDDAYYMDFGNGSSAHTDMSYTRQVRAVRAL